MGCELGKWRQNVDMRTIHGDYVGKTLIFSPYIAHIFSVPHKETSTPNRPNHKTLPQGSMLKTN